jgi:uracil-DNA glycosylase family 4
MADSLKTIAREVSVCRSCPRLVAWREEAAAHPPRRFAAEAYWAKPVPGFGDPEASVLVVGLAPAAHGGNRTGRMFTGDSSGDFLFRALHRAGFANQALSVSRDDGLTLRNCYVSAAVRCAPPDNHPAPVEFARCRPFLVREIRRLPRLEVVVALGALAWDGALRALTDAGFPLATKKPAFSHLAETRIGLLRLVGSYHVSRQNTNTGRLTEEMFDAVWRRVRTLLAVPGGP